jgi:hypothetical protein
MIPKRRRESRVNPVGTVRLRIRQSPELTVVARTRIKTSFLRMVGFGTSAICRMSGDPYSVARTAFMCVLVWGMIRAIGSG